MANALHVGEARNVVGGTVNVSSITVASQDVTIAVSPARFASEIAVAFTNDYNSGYDTNLYVDHVTLTTAAGSLTVPATDQAHVIYDRGGFFDGVDVAPGTNLLSINGALRIFLTTGAPPEIPPGTVVAFAGPVANIPNGWLYCDGSSISRATYPRLFSAIGTANGSASATTFNVPDYRGRFLRGVSDASGRDPDAAARTAMAGGGNTGNAGLRRGTRSAQPPAHGSNRHLRHLWDQREPDSPQPGNSRGPVRAQRHPAEHDRHRRQRDPASQCHGQLDHQVLTSERPGCPGRVSPRLGGGRLGKGLPRSDDLPARLQSRPSLPSSIR